LAAADADAEELVSSSWVRVGLALVEAAQLGYGRYKALVVVRQRMGRVASAVMPLLVFVLGVVLSCGLNDGGEELLWR
jgi:hypothetical protein